MKNTKNILAALLLTFCMMLSIISFIPANPGGSPPSGPIPKETSETDSGILPLHDDVAPETGG